MVQFVLGLQCQLLVRVTAYIGLLTLAEGMH